MIFVWLTRLAFFLANCINSNRWSAENCGCCTLMWSANLMTFRVQQPGTGQLKMVRFGGFLRSLYFVIALDLKIIVLLF